MGVREIVCVRVRVYMSEREREREKLCVREGVEVNTVLNSDYRT